MAIHHTVWVPAVVVGYSLGLALLFYGLEKTSGFFSTAYRALFGRHFGGTKRRMRFDKSHSSTELTNGDLGIADSPRDLQPREITLVPLPSMAESASSTPRLRTFRSKTSFETDTGHKSSGLRQLRSLRSTLSAAVNTFRSESQMRLAWQNEDEEEEKPKIVSGLGPVWVRGCDCQVPCRHKDRWRPPGPQAVVQSALKIGTSSLANPCDLAWSGLGCSVLDTATHRPKNVLQGNGGAAIPGEMVALVGPSGAGKSTLLDILAMRKGTGKVKGEVYMNGGPRGRAFKRVSAYVAQEDVFEPVLTAWETLQFHANLRLPRTTSRMQKHDRMTDTIQTMGLWKARNTQVGGLLPGGIRVRGLSGGEQRRLNIACSLVATPSIIFLDEPTTGLDSFAALNIMEHMSHLATQGHTIIATIHQPRAAIWGMFHQVNVLSEGYQVYFGSPMKAAAWFGSIGYAHRPQDGAVSDWLMDLVSVGFAKTGNFNVNTMTTRAHVSHAATLFVEESRDKMPVLPSAIQSDGTHIDSADFGKALQHRYAASWLKQLWILYARAFTTQLRNPSDICGRIFVTTSVGVLTGLVFFNLPDDPASAFQRLNALFFAIITYMLLPFCYMSFYVANRKFFHEEIAAKLYHPTAYYLANISAGLPFIIVNTLTGALSTYGLAGLRYQWQSIVLYAIITTLSSLVAIQFLTFAVWFAPNQDIAFVMGTGYTALCILVIDFFIRYDSLKVPPMQWLSWVSFPRYALQGMAYEEYNNINFTRPGSIVTGLPGGSTSGLSGQEIADAARAGFRASIVRNGQGVLDYYEFFMRPGLCIGVLIVFYVVFHLMSYAAMAYLHKSKR